MPAAGSDDALQVLGLDPVQQDAYRRLVGVPSESAESLASMAGVPVGAMAAALEALEGMGLVARSAGAPGHFVASPPSLALGSVIAQRQEDISRAALELERLAEQYRGTLSARAATDVIDVVHGPQAIAQRFAQLQRGARQEVLALVRSQFAVVSPEDNVDEDVALARGVTYRVVLERAAFERPGFLAAVTDSVRAGERVRVVDDLPLRLVVADRSLALLPLAPSAADSGTGALLVQPSGLLDALVHLFDLVWAGAKEVVPAATVDGTGTPPVRDADRIDAADAQLLTLMAAGLTDQVIGGQLEMSQRTVQRRIASLMARTGAVSRFQLGHEATSRGWLDR